MPQPTQQQNLLIPCLTIFFINIQRFQVRCRHDTARGLSLDTPLEYIYLGSSSPFFHLGREGKRKNGALFSASRRLGATPP